MNMTTIEYSYRPSEDKVNRSFDIAILVILTAVLAIRIKGILITEKTTILKERTVGRYKQATACPTGPAEFSKVMFSA